MGMGGGGGDPPYQPKISPPPPPPRKHPASAPLVYFPASNFYSSAPPKVNFFPILNNSFHVITQFKKSFLAVVIAPVSFLF